MVVRVNQERKCERCGATKKEAILTKSHAPMHKAARSALPRNWTRKFQKIYILCEHCRDNHLVLERRILAKACMDMLRLHEDYLNQ